MHERAGPNLLLFVDYKVQPVQSKVGGMSMHMMAAA